MPSLLDEGQAATSSAQRSARASGSGGGSSARAKIKLVLALICIAAAGAVTYYTLAGRDDPGAASRVRALIDSKTNEVFPEYQIADGDSFPYVNHATGERTLFPAERCYWTKDGKAKLEPTYVLLNTYAGKTGDTKCPDCGRKVVAHNPTPPSALMQEAANGK